MLVLGTVLDVGLNLSNSSKERSSMRHKEQFLFE